MVKEARKGTEIELLMILMIVFCRLFLEVQVQNVQRKNSKTFSSSNGGDKDIRSFITKL